MEPQLNPNVIERPNHPFAARIEQAAPDDLHAESLTLESVSDLLTRNSAYTPEELSQIGSVPEIEQVVERGSALHTSISEISKTYEDRLATNPKNKELLDLIDNGSDEELNKHGLDFRYMQFDKVLTALLVGKPPVDIETVGPYLCAHINPATNALEVKMENVPAEEAVGIQMAAIFKKLTRAVEGKVRIVALLDEFNNYVNERGFTQEEQDAYIVAIANLFGKAGVIEPDDEAGKDFLLLRESEQVQKVDKLIDQLGTSSNGAVTVGERGELVFKPNEEFIDSLHLSKNRRKEMQRSGIVLKDETGKALCQTLDAAGFLGDENKKLMHVVMLEKHMDSQQDKVFTILKALGITNERQYHNVFFDTQSLEPEMIVYGIAKRLQKQVEQLVNNLEAQEPEAAAA